MTKGVYAFVHERGVERKSSSGGAYLAVCLALDKIAGETVIVYGAAFDHKLHLVHERAETHGKRERFCQSKYVRSDTRGIYPRIQKDLQEGKYVLFTGTPCQNDAVKKYCTRKNIPMDRLYLMDIICHGAPSPELWEKYKEWMETKYGSPLTQFSFRYKGSRWQPYSVKAVFQNGRVLMNTFDARLYTKLFLTGLPLPEGCFHCPYANLERPSDLTIGDFWGIGRVMPRFPHRRGVSEVLINTQKGEKIWETVMETAWNNPEIRLEECLTKDYQKYQHNLNLPTPKPSGTEAFRRDLKERDFEFLSKKYGGNNWKGKSVHCVKRVLGELGILAMLKRIL